MNLYKHKENKKLYTIEHLMYNHKFADAGESIGIYAYPYNHEGNIIKLLTHNLDEMKIFVEDNFNIMTEI